MGYHHQILPVQFFFSFADKNEAIIQSIKQFDYEIYQKMKVVLLLIKLHLIEFFVMIYLNFNFLKRKKLKLATKKNYVEKDKVLNLFLWFNIFGILSVHLSFKVDQGIQGSIPIGWFNWVYPRARA